MRSLHSTSAAPTRPLSLSLVALVSCIAIAPATSGCTTRDDDFYGSYSEIVFGITQEKDPATGTVKTTAGYELLQLGGRGSRGTLVDWDDSLAGRCWIEDLDARLGRPRLDSGEAIFAGGKLAEPVRLLANQPTDVEVAGAGWATGDTLSFGSTGFAAPAVGPMPMYAPSAELDVLEPPLAAPEGSPEGSVLALRASEDLRVRWALPSGAAGEGGRRPVSRVMVALDSDPIDGKQTQVRCFYDGSAGEATIARDAIAELMSTAPRAPDGALRGRLRVATHSQLTIYARGAWIIYAVATAQHRNQPFLASP